MSISKWLLRAIGLVIFVIVIANINIQNTLAIFKGKLFMTILLLILTIIVIILIRAWRWVILLSGQNIKIKFFKAATVILSTTFVSNVLPGRFGEVVRIFYLKSRGNTLVKSTVSVFLDRVQDTVVIFILGFGGLIFFSSQITGQYTLYLVILCMMIMLMIFVFSEKLRSFCFSLILKVFLSKYASKLKSHLQTFSNEIKQVGTMRIIITTILAFVNWIAAYIVLFAVARVLDIQISFVGLAMATSLSSIILAIPITYAGIGSRDALFALLFPSMGLTIEQGVAYSAVILLMTIIVTIAGFVSWSYEPISFKKLK